MALREIVTLPDPVLRRKARKVTEVNKDTQALIDDMVETMRQAPGVGLAAPQVNVSERIIVVEYDENDQVEDSPKKLYVFLNPEITPITENKEMGIEACLSIPGLAGEVERFTDIQVKGLNRRGKPAKLKASGWLARIFQHEVDHIDGVVFTDRAVRVWKPTPDEEHLLKD